MMMMMMGELELKICNILHGYLWAHIEYEWGQPVARIEDIDSAANAIVRLLKEQNEIS